MSAAKPAVCNYLQMHFQDLSVWCIDIDTRARTSRRSKDVRDEAVNHEGEGGDAGSSSNR